MIIILYKSKLGKVGRRSRDAHVHRLSAARPWATAFCAISIWKTPSQTRGKQDKVTRSLGAWPSCLAPILVTQEPIPPIRSCYYSPPLPSIVVFVIVPCPKKHNCLRANSLAQHMI